jgi:hypothetical protein
MSFVDFIRGVGNVLIILVIAGAVAYVGDRVGHQVGRRRLTLFGIRPRYTSTIVAVATGVIIALVVTLIAIMASQQVKTAFFRLSALNSQITTLTQQEQQLEQKVRTGRLVLPVGQLITPLRLILTQSQTPAEQMTSLRTFYGQAVRYINQVYTGERGLKPYVIPHDIDATLSAWLNDSRIQSELVRSNVMLTTITDQNLFVNDPIHFAISPVPDVRTFAKGQFIASLRVPGNGEADIAIAVRELDAEVTENAILSGMPRFLATYVQPTELVPGPEAMQQMLQRTGTYDLIAYASDDIYPHTFGVYVVIALVPQKGR